MARQIRVEYLGAIYHVTVRSNGGDDLFWDDRDRKRLLFRLAEAVKTHEVRVYLYCLMSNHFHLVVETPKGNLGRFMQGVLTGYGVYYNRRHSRHGHVTQGRYGAKLVAGNEYLLKLSRYVHLNPVKVKGMSEKPHAEKTAYLRGYAWSTYPGYIGTMPRNKFVDYEPMLSLVDGSKSERPENYRRFVEGGIAADDESFLGEMVRSPLSIGGTEYREWVDDCYRELVENREKPEDVSFRRTIRPVSADAVLEAVSKAAGIRKEDLTRRQRDARWRAAASWLLCRHGGMTQREAAETMGLTSGVAVSCQLKKLRALLATDARIKTALDRLDRKLAAKLC